MDFIVSSFLLLILYLGVTTAMISHLPTVRNGAAFLVASLSAYTFSIALDTVWASVFGPRPPSLVPIAAGALYGFGFYSAARKLATQPIAARAAYLVVATLCLFAGIVGHKQNFAAGGLR
jgi:hypothetical protein